jgi:hypothetical protein
MQMLKKGDYILRKAQNSKKLTVQAMDSVLHEIIVRKRLSHDDEVHIHFRIGEMSGYSGKHSLE